MLRPKAATDATTSMSTLLLQGWAMLAESCLDCQVPLMRKRGEDDTFCVNCKCTFDKDGKLKGQGKGGDSQAPSAKQQGPPAPASAAQGGGSAGATAEKSPLDVFRAMRQEAALSSPGSRPPAATTDAKDGAAPDPSEEIAAKMLEGWALTGIHCPRSGVPLLRNKEGKLWSVGCQAWVLTPEQAEAAAAAKKSAEEEEERPEQQPAPRGVKKDSMGTGADISVQEKRRAAAEKADRQLQGVEIAARKHKAAPAEGPAAPEDTLTSQAASAEPLSLAASAIMAKMSEAAQELASVPASHTTSCLQYIQLIRECSSAIGELQDLAAKHQRLE